MLFATLLACHFALAAIVVYGMNQLALVPWRRTRDAHWTARARLLWPIRKTNGLLFFIFPAVLAAAQYSQFPEIPLAYLPAAVAGFAGVILGMWPTAKAVFPNLALGRWLRNLAAVFVIRLMAVGVLIAAIFLMPNHLGWTAVGVTALVIALNLGLVWGGALWILRRMGVLIPAPPRLQEIVREIATRMDLPMPRVGLLRLYGANAIAFPLLNTLAVTEMAMDVLPDDELGAVCAHEFGHLSEPRGTVAMLVLSTFTLLPAIFFKPATHAFGWAGYFGICALLIVVSRLVRAFRRRMEQRADSAAKTHEGPSPGVYARALERLYELNQVPAVTPATLSHPSLYDRLIAAGVTPEYPRPAAPARFTWQNAVALGLVVAFITPVMNRWERDGRQKAHRPRQWSTEGRPMPAD
ncbi:peptidase M48 Ste24p [Chthoniobacter flavus Ellin428]|uniref:Peptidase M48 Ste24p n=1 Tax=Chthoniobacter flavus Ellin428 TaxID=497964 RepID=B4D0P1_9BACT|nr:M48 family metalloprotease [Chthoniobacter flavus]EDY19903.1 peptidase M48 Ste24p [Chthoniobacter flavus Ellin428]TCO91826.1 Zn-dependent protease with chaperone function [Chthoniobacter flavus]